MIVDVFMFNDEFDMLDCRLYQLRGLVDRFIPIEANRTCSGIEKPYHLTENINRYPDVPLDILRVDLSGISGVWERDRVQRDAATGLLLDLPPEAVVITGDLDEIPRRDLVSGFTGRPTKARGKHLVYSLTALHWKDWTVSTIVTRRDYTNAYDVRHAPQDRFLRVDDGGWHLSYFGTPEERTRKMVHYAHQELRHLAESVGEDLPRKHLHVDGSTLTRDQSTDWPDWATDGLAPAHWYTDWWEES